MKNSTKKFRPYVRRANGSEMADSYRVAFRLAYYRLRGKPFYVLMQHGFPGRAVDCGRSKREVQQGPIMVSHGGQTFRQWAASIQRRELPNRKRVDLRSSSPRETSNAGNHALERMQEGGAA